MTAARTAAEWVESMTVADIAARAAAEWVESVTVVDIKPRVAAEWVEVIVGGAEGPTGLTWGPVL